ncbi:hypothetical protein N7513_003228 [Penicillium frequentans]|uniref:Uncharacterized protein n=1 Tax=Penicillium frequentans TaxID=3151616 RepID=A0AAD6CHF8_9EURO|nr:hypothetical protein N7494_013231 [Penicillium glabrum]KAJ5557642.1 hypothetical protein N7513_003228 [Penicillium glabrum]
MKSSSLTQIITFAILTGATPSTARSLVPRGHFYLLNEATGDCNPPWAYLASSEPSLPGFNCED